MPGDVLSTWKAKLGKGLRALEEQNQRRSLAEIRRREFLLQRLPRVGGTSGVARCRGPRGAALDASGRNRRRGCSPARPKTGANWKRCLRSLRRRKRRCFSAAGMRRIWDCCRLWSDRDDVVFSDVLNHASLIDGMRLSGARKVIYPHLNLSVLEDSLRQDAGAPWRRVIVTESIFSMNGDVAPLEGDGGPGGEVRRGDDCR